MQEIVDGLPGVVSIHDDIAVHGPNVTEHDKNLHLLMQRAREKGLVFSPKKCNIRQSEIVFFGNIYSADGVDQIPQKFKL